MAETNFLSGSLEPMDEQTSQPDAISGREEMEDHPPDENVDIGLVEANAMNAPLSAELTAFQAELELVGPRWNVVLTQDYPEATADQISALMGGKLQQAIKLIPIRRKAEKRFENDCQVLEQLHVKFSKVLLDFQSKSSDQSARIEHFKARRFAEDLMNTRLPALESSYHQAADAWFKPEIDPLIEQLAAITSKMEDMVALFEYEASIRPVIQTDGHNAQVTDHMTNPRDCKTVMQFDASKLISSFDGNVNDPDVLLKFSNWKSSWGNLVEEMKTLRGFNTTVLFQKLKDCLKDNALTLVDKYSCESTNSYEAAMSCLLEKYEDPITLAGSYISSGTASRDSPAEHADAIRQAFNALTNMRDIFDREGVDLYDFALMRTFITSMCPESQAKWNAYKIQKKLEYNLECEKAAKINNPLPCWRAGMVECREQFEAWLSLQSVQYRRPSSGSGAADESQSTAANFTLCKTNNRSQSQEQVPFNPPCFLCPGNTSHPLTRCRRGLAMNYREWRQACSRESRCFTCALPFTPGHKCEGECPFCKRRHHPVMCPDHHGRQSSRRDRAPPSRREQVQPKSQLKRALETGLELSEEPMEKLAKQILKSVTAQLKGSKPNSDKPEASSTRGGSRKRK